MKNPFKSICLLTGAVIVLLHLHGCEDKDEVQIIEKDLFVSVSGTGNFNYTMPVSIVSTIPDTTLGIHINLTKATVKEIQAQLDIDTALVTTYNKKYNTQFRLLPSANYQFSSSEVTVNAGKDRSLDSASLLIKNVAQLRAKNYLLPISIKNISGNKDALISDSVKTLYINVILTDVVQTVVSLDDGNTSSNLVYKNGATGAGGPVTIQAIINRPSIHDIKAKIAINNSLADPAHDPFPVGSFTLSSTSITILAGQVQSASGLVVTIPDLTRFDNSKSYILPLVLQSLAGDNDADPSTRVIYIELSFSNINSGNQSPSGTLLDRTSWTVSVSSFYDESGFGGIKYGSNFLMDADNSTKWISDGGLSFPHIVIVNMKSSHAVKTISYTNAYDFFGDDISPKDITVYSSQDGVSWKKEGLFNNPDQDSGNTSEADPFINYINFFEPIQCSYFKLEIAGSNSYFGNYVGMAEINTYE